MDVLVNDSKSIDLFHIFLVLQGVVPWILSTHITHVTREDANYNPVVITTNRSVSL